MKFAHSLRAMIPWVLGFSLANLVYAPVWSVLDSWFYWFFTENLPNSQHYLAFALNVLLMGVLLGSAFSLLEHRSPLLRRCAKLLILLMLIISVNGIRTLIPGINVHALSSWMPKSVIFGIFIGTGLAALLALVKFRDRFIPFLEMTLMILAPFGLFAVGSAFVRSLNLPQQHLTNLANYLEEAPQPARVLWILFDEADQRLIEASIDQLPNLKRLRETAFVGDVVYAPARNTERAIPALLTGRLVAATKPVGSSEFHVKFQTHFAKVSTGNSMADQDSSGNDAAGSDPARNNSDGNDSAGSDSASPRADGAAGTEESVDFLDFSKVNTIFRRGRDLGFNSGLVGWHLPYCRLLPQDLAACEAFGLYDPLFAETVPLQMKKQLSLLPLPRLQFIRSFVGQTLGIHWMAPWAFESQVRRYQNIMDASARMISNERLKLAFLHFPIPHPPFILDSKTDSLSVQGGGDYLSNLRLMDRTIENVLRWNSALPEAQRWSLLITSDHWLRKRAENMEFLSEGREADRRVPFILKLRSDDSNLSFKKPFNNVHSSDLVLDVITGKVRTHHDVADWLSAHVRVREPTFVDEQMDH